MTKRKDMMAEVDELMKNGHADALEFWADRSVRLYRQGLMIGSVIIIGFELAGRVIRNKIKNK